MEKVLRLPLEGTRHCKPSTAIGSVYVVRSSVSTFTPRPHEVFFGGKGVIVCLIQNLTHLHQVLGSKTSRNLGRKFPPLSPRVLASYEPVLRIDEIKPGDLLPVNS